MLALEAKPGKLVGNAKPRIAPPVPARSGIAGYEAISKVIGLSLAPWQKTAGRYLEALGPKDRLLYREVAIVVARQNGKTTLLLPLIVGRLLAGRRIMHTAQNAKLPRDIHEALATVLLDHYPDKLPAKRAISYAVGHEQIKLLNGGLYRIVAPTHGGARGPSNDLVIVDEARELEDYAFIHAAKPTLTASPNPQFVYLSNAGSEDSEVLNDLRKRRDADPILAYLEWSADPDRDLADRVGWQQSNPSLGHLAGVLETLQTEHRTAMLTGKTAGFETEHLCRWVTSDDERVVSEADWLARRGEIGQPVRPSMAVSLDPTGRRASAALAWQRGDHVELRIEANVSGSPIDTEALGRDLQARARDLNVRQIGYDDWTDKDLARWLKNARTVAGHEFAAASDKFDRIVRAGGLTWDAADDVTEDLRWLTRKAHETGAWQAVRATDEHSVTAALAAIRAVWLASEPPRPRIAAFLA